MERTLRPGAGEINTQLLKTLLRISLQSSALANFGASVPRSAPAGDGSHLFHFTLPITGRAILGAQRDGRVTRAKASFALPQMEFIVLKHNCQGASAASNTTKARPVRTESMNPA